MLFVAGISVLFCLFSLSCGQPPPPPGPPRPIISKSFISLLYVNYTTTDGTTKFTGVEHYAVNALERKRIINITDDHQEQFHITQLYLFNDNKGYSIEWNKEITLGQCSAMPVGEFDDVFKWVEQSNYGGYEEFLDWTIWTYNDGNGTQALLIVMASDSSVPIYMAYTNGTISYVLNFLSFEPKQPLEYVFLIPPSCTKSGRNQHETVGPIGVMPDYNILSIINRNIITSGKPNVFKYTGKIDPFVKKMVNQAIIS